MTVTRKQTATSIPQAMYVQLARLFGNESNAANAVTRTPQDWKRMLSQVLDELEYYLEENVHTDEVHYLMLLSGLCAAKESLKEKEFFIGYIEGLTRFALLLMGDYPDHRGRRHGRKKAGYYELSHHRSQAWLQNADQRLRTLIAAWRLGAPKLTKNPIEALREFREQFGNKPGHKEFLEWYKQMYPQDYAAVF